jgi:hypothetical protein
MEIICVYIISAPANYQIGYCSSYQKLSNVDFSLIAMHGTCTSTVGWCAGEIT